MGGWLWLRRGQGLRWFAAFVLGFMVVVVLEGAVVRATGSGAGCGNHWPLCNGDFFPSHPRLATVIEYVHRSLTAGCTVLVLALIAWVFAARGRGHRSRTAVVATGVLLLTEAFLGAVLVKGGYVETNASTMRVVMQCVHFSNTMLLLGALMLTWWWLGERVERPLSVAGRSLAWAALGATIFVGATGSVAALADTLFPAVSLRAGLADDLRASAPLLVRMRWLHPAASVLALGFALGLAFTLRSRVARVVVGLVAAQIVLGGADVLLLAPTWMQVLHLLGADVYWIALVAACAGVFSRRV